MNRDLLAAASLAATVMLGGCALQRQALVEDAPAPKVEPTATPEVVAFCGPTTTNPAWRTQLATLRRIGVTAVHGYCYTPPADYTVTTPGARYASQAEYLELAAEAQRLGMGIVAYDPTFWTDPTTAAATWAPYIADGTLVAVDLGDEPHWLDMPELARRAELVRTTGVEPVVIFVGSSVFDVAEQHRHLPTDCPTSDDYATNTGAKSDALRLREVAGCAGIAIDVTGRNLDGDRDIWSLDLIRWARTEGLKVALFTGVQPENYPTWGALVDHDGRITSAGLAVQEALS